MGNKIRLGDLLVRAGLITESDLRVVLAQQKQHGGRLGEHLVRVNLCSDEQIARALGKQLGLVFNDLSQPPSQVLTALIPEKVAARLQALAVAYDPRTQQLSVAFSDPLDEEAIAEVARVTGKSVLAQVTPANPLRRAIEHAYFGVEVRDEGTSEFQLVDIHGRSSTVKVPGRGGVEEDDLPVLHTGDFEPVDSEEEAAPEDDREFAPVGGQPAVAPSGRTPAAPPAARPPAPAPQKTSQPATPDASAGDEALRMVWAIADVLIERGYFTRAELMKSLRGKA